MERGAARSPVQELDRRHGDKGVGLLVERGSMIATNSVAGHIGVRVRVRVNIIFHCRLQQSWSSKWEASVHHRSRVDVASIGSCSVPLNPGGRMQPSSSAVSRASHPVLTGCPSHCTTVRGVFCGAYRRRVHGHANKSVITVVSVGLIERHLIIAGARGSLTAAVRTASLGRSTPITALWRATAFPRWWRYRRRCLWPRWCLPPCPWRSRHILLPPHALTTLCSAAVERCVHIY